MVNGEQAQSNIKTNNLEATILDFQPPFSEDYLMFTLYLVDNVKSSLTWLAAEATYPPKVSGCPCQCLSSSFLIYDRNWGQCLLSGKEIMRLSPKLYYICILSFCT
jgi:hypothetical protein